MLYPMLKSLEETFDVRYNCSPKTEKFSSLFFIVLGFRYNGNKGRETAAQLFPERPPIHQRVSNSSRFT